MKRELYLEIGGLDESYFMYGEDMNLCYTLLKKGYQNWYYSKNLFCTSKAKITVKDEKHLF